MSDAPAVLRAVKQPFSLDAVKKGLEGTTEQISNDLASETQAVQDKFHSQLRDLFTKTATDASVIPKPAQSLRELAANTAQAIKGKASSLYKQLDEAIGGGTSFQEYDAQIQKVQRALRQDVGIDPDYTGKLIEHLNSLEDAKSAALEIAKANGTDPALINNANQLWRQGSALEDLPKHIQASTSGLRGDLAKGASVAQEAVSPAKLATRANRLYNTGRLQQALGEDRANDLLTATETSQQQAKDAAQRAVDLTEKAKANAAQQADTVKMRRVIAGTAAGASLGGIPGFELLKHLLGN